MANRTFMAKQYKHTIVLCRRLWGILNVWKYPNLLGGANFLFGFYFLICQLTSLWAYVPCRDIWHGVSLLGCTEGIRWLSSRNYVRLLLIYLTHSILSLWQNLWATRRICREALSLPKLQLSILAVVWASLPHGHRPECSDGRADRGGEVRHHIHSHNTARVSQVLPPLMCHKYSRLWIKIRTITEDLEQILLVCNCCSTMVSFFCYI